MRQTFVFHGTSGARLDAFLGTEMKSRERAKRAIQSGEVMINGKVVQKPSTPLFADDTVDIDSPDDPISRSTIAPADIALEILYEDESCLVISKPRDIAVHPAPGIPKEEATILHAAAYLFAERGITFAPAETLVHRLDKETTGCVLLAKTPKAHLQLQKQFQARTIGKTYVALVAGTPRPAEAFIDAPIGRSSSDRTKMSVLRTNKGRESKTKYVLQGSSKGTSLLYCDLLTGRTHQLRVHLETIGHPILGDTIYGTRSSQKLSSDLHIDFLCLHAWKISFDSLKTKKRVEIECELPEDFSTILESLEFTVKS